MAAFKKLASFSRHAVVKNSASFHSIVTSKLVGTCGLGDREAALHFRQYLNGSRNGMTVFDSDKTLICLRNALDFIGTLINQKSRFFLLKTDNPFLHEIMEEMANSIEVSQWKIGSQLKSCDARPKKLRSVRKKISLGFTHQPDCIVILDADMMNTSVIREAYRSHIPVVSFVGSTAPVDYFERITYPIPTNGRIELPYLFCQQITYLGSLAAGKRAVLSQPASQVIDNSGSVLLDNSAGFDSGNVSNAEDAKTTASGMVHQEPNEPYLRPPAAELQNFNPSGDGSGDASAFDPNEPYLRPPAAEFQNFNPSGDGSGDASAFGSNFGSF